MRFRTPEGMAIGRRIKALRLSLGLTHHEFADMAGCSFDTIRNAELGRTRLGVNPLQGLAVAGHDVTYLLTGFTVEENRARLNRAA